ncbi:BREX-1 system phosphatase PglZ type A [Thermomonas aquatica]|uniref:BREX-1 system phosphatase PglZ type A n=1 Tax=Thermomonas aquatica TaxID=2202149 RepID=A0A5B7ZQ27_9GAMM|nr:BREX-1 system phosphatase PglZ type A [Thermomonas aquatica]QDA56987.1 BREX-1 system phosphatase PglZ type A [Thermomonas aquatica]
MATELNEQRISEALAALFASANIIFWHDIDGEFADVLDKLELDPVKVIRLQDTAALEVKRRIESDGDGRFLLYSNRAEPDPTADWLLDIRLRSHSFRADLTSIRLEELGLSSVALAPHIRARAKFLAAESRRNRLKRLLQPMDGAADVDRKMIAVTLRCDESDPLSLALQLLSGLSEGDAAIGEPPKAWSDLQGYGLEQAFWQLIKDTFGYESPEPSLADLLRRILVTDFARSLTGDPPEALAHLRLKHPSFSGNASVLAARWRSDLNRYRAYAGLSAAVAQDLRISELVSGYSAEDLLDCMTFAQVERRVIHDLKGRVLQLGGAAADSIQPLIDRRRDGHWADVRLGDDNDEFRAVASCYEALEAAADFLALKERHATGMTFANAEHAVQQYRGELYRFDQLYRHFHHASSLVEPMGWSVLHDLDSLIESAYSGWFIPMLSSAWASIVENEGGMLEHWNVNGLLPQQQFFNDHVANQLATTKRVYVVISDAFRYEAGEELTRELRRKNRFTAELSAMLSVLPSYTALGMSALLPHHTLAYKPGESLDVLVDGQPAATLDARNAQLGRYDGIAVRAADLMELGKTKGRELVGDHRVIYVYHDLIDMTGDKQGSEGKTFDAVSQTLIELNRIISFIINNLNGSMVLVTADHGFLYQESPLDQASKASLGDKPAGTLRAKKRYLIGRDLAKNTAVWQGSTATTAGTEPGAGSVDFWLPKGAMRFHFAGGARFVHGSAMPQEVIVPMITVRVSESEKARSRSVEVSVVGASSKIVTNKQRLDLIQSEPVSHQVRPRTLKISLRDGDTLISDEATVTFDSTSAVLAERIKQIFLTVRSGSYDRHKDYYLVGRDAATSVEVLRAAYRIDLAFSNDF